jgi:hypothetical protein
MCGLGIGSLVGMGRAPGIDKVQFSQSPVMGAGPGRYVSGSYLGTA